MTIKECETRIEDINQRFREYFHIDFDVDVFLLGKASVETKRAALFYYHCNFTKAKEIRNHRLQAIISDFSCLAPPVGLEPTTLRLTAACSTD